MDISGRSAPKAKAPLQPFRYAAASLGPMDETLHITRYGICHSDLHLINDGWRGSRYPLVLGHEILSEVTYLGSLMTHLNDRMVLENRT